jgi:CBS domain-containing protein
MIVDPVTIRPDRPVREALQVMERFHISGVPVVDETGHLWASSPTAIFVSKHGSTFLSRR